MRCLDGPIEQARNTEALDEKNRAKLVKDKPARPEGQLEKEKTGSRDLVKLERRRQEFVIVNNVDAYDDVKITCRSISKELWRKIPVVKEVTSWEGNQLRNKLRARQCLCVMYKPARHKETRWLSSNKPDKKSSSQE
ncbi:K(+) efflux antiporter 2, chloroplastic [Dorcoceras hygrometricum]|uniref:K(+) efflux antiporter 2, chloroplastic n=1 Tax=Dorcoceras hygrometricum TaxID=472368 RepID=A0A2Z7C5K9_9LAMI|nr:K(+) efflux antiporter 2, chloroplastic [Dorcoceras hygrometricum]